MSNPIKSPDVAPVLQSMQDYICNHFTDELMDEVSAAVSLGLVEHLDMNAEDGKLVVNRNESKIIRTDFWCLDRTKLLADIKMRVKIGVSRDGSIPHYVVRYSRCLAAGMEWQHIQHDPQLVRERHGSHCGDHLNLCHVP